MASEKELREKYSFDKELDKDSVILSDSLDLLSSAIRVHTKGIDLNEDATLSNLDQEFSRQAKFIIAQLETTSILRSYLKTNKKIIRYDNRWDPKQMRWLVSEEIIVENPEKKIFEECKDLMLDRVRNMLILSRSIKGSPLKAFLTYGRDTTNKELGLEQKQGFMDKLLGKKKQEELQ